MELSSYMRDMANHHRHVYRQPKYLHPAERVCRRCGLSEEQIKFAKKMVGKPSPRQYKEWVGTKELSNLIDAQREVVEGYNGFCSYSMIYRNPSGQLKTRSARTAACYYGFQTFAMPSYWLWTRPGRTQPIIEAMTECNDRWIKWLFNEFHLRHVYSTTEKYFRETGVIGVDCNRDLTPQEVFAALILIRYMSDKTYVVNGWDKFVQHGVDPCVAFVMAHHIACWDNGAKTASLLYEPMVEGHMILQKREFGVNSLRNLLNGEISRERLAGRHHPQYIRDGSHFSPLSFIWGMEPGQGLRWPEAKWDHSAVDSWGTPHSIKKWDVSTKEAVLDLANKFLEINGAS